SSTCHRRRVRASGCPIPLQPVPPPTAGCHRSSPYLIPSLSGLSPQLFIAGSPLSEPSQLGLQSGLPCRCGLSSELLPTPDMSLYCAPCSAVRSGLQAWPVLTVPVCRCGLSSELSALPAFYSLPSVSSKSQFI
ncbi:unnamed protein product, partial [Staurois parvus]